MLKNYVFFIFILLFNLSHAQEKFQKGYFVLENGSRTECLIKNIDWKNNPTSFKYRMSESTEVKESTISTVKEFAILDRSKFIKANIDIDMSTDNFSNLQHKKDPEWKKSQIFLRVILEGDANLYYYETANLRRYFYSLGKGEKLQLIYKRYLSNDNRSTLYNNGFRQQLFSSFFTCRSLGMENYDNLKYNKSSMVNIFEKYNSCMSGNSGSYADENKDAKTKLNVRVKVGMFSNSYKLKRTTTSIPDVEFDTKYGARLGVEGELILPFNNDKWGLFFGVEKNIGQSNTTTIASSVSTISFQEVELKYESIEFMLGFNYYYKLNNNSKLYLRLGYLLDYHSEKTLDYESSTDLEGTDLKTGNFFGGVGFIYKRIAIETKMNFGKKLFSEFSFVEDDLKDFNVMLTYSIL